jgi:hypothetical protein
MVLLNVVHSPRIRPNNARQDHQDHHAQQDIHKILILDEPAAEAETLKWLDYARIEGGLFIWREQGIAHTGPSFETGF